MKVKIFPSFVEYEINDWLKKNKDINIRFIKQSEALTDDDWQGTISIWYEELNRLNITGMVKKKYPKS